MAPPPNEMPGGKVPARLRVLCFYPPESTLPDLQAWVSENGPGSLRVVGAK